MKTLPVKKSVTAELGVSPLWLDKQVFNGKSVHQRLRQEEGESQPRTFYKKIPPEIVLLVRPRVRFTLWKNLTFPIKNYARRQKCGESQPRCSSSIFCRQINNFGFNIFRRIFHFGNQSGVDIIKSVNEIFWCAIVVLAFSRIAVVCENALRQEVCANGFAAFFCVWRHRRVETWHVTGSVQPKNETKMNLTFFFVQPENETKMNLTFSTVQPKNKTKMNLTFSFVQPKNKTKMNLTFSFVQPKIETKMNLTFSSVQPVNETKIYLTFQHSIQRPMIPSNCFWDHNWRETLFRGSFKDQRYCK